MTHPKKKAPNRDGNPRRGDKTTTPNSSTPPVRRSTRWKDLERTAAQKLRGRRIVRGDFFQPSPDVRVDDIPGIVECKAYEKFAFHRHVEQARRYCRGHEIPILVTKETGQIGEYVTLPLDAFAAILDELREARHVQK